MRALNLLIFCLFFSSIGYAAGIKTSIRYAVPLRQTSDPDGRMLGTLKAGEEVEVVEWTTEPLQRVRVQRSAKWFTGYVDTMALADSPAVRKRRIAFGLGFAQTQLSQKGKSFETEDEVHYTTSAYTSQTLAPFLSAQLGEENFWRVVVAMKTSDYHATAQTDVLGSREKSVRLSHKFISLLVQRAYNPFGWQNFYIGLGAELAKATSVKLKLDEVELTTNSQDQPTYIGGQGFMGGQFHITPHWSAYGEARFGAFPNQTPMIVQIEVAACLLYWL